MSKHLNKTYGNWKVLNKEHSGKFYVQCLLCNEVYVRTAVTDIAKGRSAHCKKCSLAKVIIIMHSKSRTREGKANPNWRGTKNIPCTYLTFVKANAKARNLEINISLHDLQNLWDKQKGKCIFSGEVLSFNIKGKLKDSPTASLDRIDSSKGYLVDNIQWTSSHINLMKRKLSDEEFLVLIKKIYDHRVRQ